MSKRLDVPHKWVLALCYNESMFKHDAKNPKSTATGIIQFTAGTALKLGTSVEAIRKMSCTKQLKYVEKYLRIGIDKYGKYQSLTDLYLWCLLPDMRLHCNEPSYVIMKKGDKYYHLNYGLDTNGDGLILVKEISQRMQKKLKSF